MKELGSATVRGIAAGANALDRPDPARKVKKHVYKIAFSEFLAGHERFRAAFSDWCKPRVAYEFDCLTAMLYYRKSPDKRTAINIIEKYLEIGAPCLVKLETAALQQDEQLSRGKLAKGTNDPETTLERVNEIAETKRAVERTTRDLFRRIKEEYQELREQASRMNFVSRYLTSRDRKADSSIFNDMISVMLDRTERLWAYPWAETPAGKLAFHQFDTWGSLLSLDKALSGNYATVRLVANMHVRSS